MSAIPTILKGDDSGTITLTLDGEHTYDGATLVVAYQGKTKTFSDLTAGGSVGLAFSHDETADFALGCFPLLAQLVGAAGAVETISNAEWRVKTTDIVSEVNAAGSFAVTPGAAFVPIEDVGAVGETYTLKSLKAKLDEVIRVLAQRTATTCVAALLALPVFGGGVETATLEDLPNTAAVVTNVDLTTSNATLVATIEAVAPTPGDYANVSNRAMNAANASDLAAATNGLARAEDIDFTTNNTTLVETIEEVAPIAATNPTFSNAVLSVGLGIGTNAVAAINALVEEGDDLPVGGATAVGALLAALAAAVAALRKAALRSTSAAPAWAANTAYSANAPVTNAGLVYICAEDHTSGSDFATDLAAGKWTLTPTEHYKLKVNPATGGIYYTIPD